MQIKLFEIRDRATFIPAISIRLDPSSEEERYLISRAGYGKHQATQRKYILLGRLNDLVLKLPINWLGEASRTMGSAHKYIEKYWSSLESGQVIDVEYILGETVFPKESERHA